MKPIYDKSKLLFLFLIFLFTSLNYQAQNLRQAYPEATKTPEIFKSSLGSNQFLTPKETNGDFSTTVYTFGDIAVFSYFDNTQISVYDASNVLKYSQTLTVDSYKSWTSIGAGVYRIVGNKTYTVLVGDAFTNTTNGYFAIDEAGRGVSTKLSTWMMGYRDTGNDFIVFAYNDNTGFTVKNLTTGAVLAAGTLNAGQYYSFNASGTIPFSTPLQVIGTKPISALSYTDQDYYVPASNGTFVGTLFYGYSAYIGSWANTITVTSYADNNNIVIKNLATGATIKSVTLQRSQVYSERITAPTFWSVTSTGSVSAANIPFAPEFTGAYQYMTRAIDETGHGFGKLFFMPTIGSSIYVFSFEAGNNVTITRLGDYTLFPYPTPTQVYTGTLNEGQYYNFTSTDGHYVYKIESTKNSSVVQSNGGYGADFMPLAYSSDYPDLAVSTGDIAYSKTDADINAGDNITVTVTVHNYGSIAASNVLCYAYDGDPDAGGNAPLIGNGTISTIAVNGTGTFSFTYKVPTSPEYHQLVVKVDPTNQIIESNESNNKAQRSIRPSVDLQPPLAISVTATSSLLLSSGVLTPNPFPVHLDIFNTGAVAATNVVVTLALFEGLSSVTLVRTVGTINASTTATADFSITANPAISGFNRYNLSIAATGLTTKILNRAVNVPDAVPPSAPQGFSGQVAGSGSASFTWNANTATDLAGYFLYYSTDGINYTTATGANQGNSPVLIINSTSITLTGLAAGNYWFMLKAFDTSNNLSSASLVVQLAISGSTTTQVLFYGNGNGTTYTLSGANTGYVFGANSYLDIGKYQRFDFTGSGQLTAARIYFSVKKIVGATDNFNVVVRSVGTAGAPQNLLYSKTYSVSIIDTSNKGVVYNTFVLDTPLSVSSPFFIGIEWTGSIDDSFAILADPNLQGENQKRAWEKWSDGTYHDMFSQYSIQSVSLDADMWIAAVLSVSTGVEDNINEIPSNYVLYQNYPNPFNPSTKIRYSLPQTTHVKLVLYNVLGVQILTLIDSEQQIGNHEIELNGNNLASGVYFIKMNAGNYSVTKKIMLMK
ncbi:MAG: T9SS type A sorting domain-containing protein [Ignavibacteriales bacterium]|nr:T9SS type A sorting domain-containing protein [Ignavibacteriales bacterium]